MAYTRRNTSEDIRANRAWTADAEVDLASIPAKHGDVAYVTATSQAHIYVDGSGWVNISTSAGDISDGDTLSIGLTFPNTGLHILDTNASHDLIIVPGSDLTADRNLTVTTGDAARTLTLSGDTTLSGGSHSGTNSGDVTLAGTPDYITIAGQVITRNAVDLAADVTGTLDESNGGTGQSSYTAGDLLYASGATTLSKLAAGASDEVLQGGATPSWTSTPSLDGIVFPATQVASANVNTLDDYEEGSWTPALNFGGASTGITYNQQLGRYQKIGNTVFITIEIELTSKGSSTGVAQFTGLPFTSLNGRPLGTLTTPYSASMAGLTSPISGLVLLNNTAFYLYDTGATGIASVDDTNFTNTSYLIMFGFYTAAN